MCVLFFIMGYGKFYLVCGRRISLIYFKITIDKYINVWYYIYKLKLNNEKRGMR